MMKMNSESKKARDLEIYRRRKAGETYQSLAMAFGLSDTWISKICYRERRLEYQPSRQKEEKPQRLEDTELYLLLIRDHPVVTSSGKPSAIPLQAYHCLYRLWIKTRTGDKGHPTIDFLCSLQDEQIRNIRRVGVATYNYLLRIRQELVKQSENRSDKNG